MRDFDGEKAHQEKPSYDLAVVVVHWRVPELLHSCLTSLVSERDRSALSIQIIVVDTDADPPQSHNVAHSFGGVDFVWSGETAGYAAGCNVGIQASNSRAVLLLNPDIVVLDRALDRLWKILFISEHIGLVAPLLLNPDRTIQSSGYQFPGLVNLLLDLYPLHPRLIESAWNGRLRPNNAGLPYRVDYPLGAAMMLKRSALEEVGLLCEDYFMYCEEIDLAKRLERHGWTRLLVPDAQFVHYGGESTKLWSDPMNETLWRSRAAYHSRWSGRTQQWLQSWIVRTSFVTRQRRFSKLQRLSSDRIISAFCSQEDGIN